MTKMRVGPVLALLTAALFANSPFVEGKPFPGAKATAQVVARRRQRSIRSRSTMEEDRHLHRLRGVGAHVPCSCSAERGGREHRQTFRSFWKSGFSGHKPNFGD